MPYAGQIVHASDAPPSVWTAYTPTWTGASTNPVINNGVISAEYYQVGKLVAYRGIIQPGSTTTFGSGLYSVSLPVTAEITLAQSPHYGIWIRDTSPAADYQGFALLATTTTFQVRGTSAAYAGNTVWSPTGPVTLASGDWMSWCFTYKAA